VVKFTPDASVSQQLLHRFRLEIVGGKYPPGEQFPTVRALAFVHSVNPNTVQKVLALLEEDGLLINRGTVGRFVTEDENAIAAVMRILQADYLKKMKQDALALGITQQQIAQFFQESEENT